MITLSADEYKKKYGDSGVKAFDSISNAQGERPGLLSRIGTDLSKRGAAVNDLYDSKKNFASKTLQLVGQGAGFAGDIGAEALKSAGDVTGATEALKPVGVAVLNTPLGQEGIKALQGGMETYNKFKQSNPEIAGNLEAVLNIASILPIGKGAQLAGKGALKVAETGANLINDTTRRSTSLVKDVAGGAMKAVTDTAKPEAIMQRVARIPKGAQASFEKTAGESVGKYLTTRGIYGDSEQIAKQLFDRFSTSKNAADEAIAKLPGTYKPTPLKTALNELVQREKRVSSPGALSQDFKRTRELVNKYSKDGLTMSEVNEVKRLFERNVRLDFVKQNLPESVARSTNIDDALRKWQFSQAEKLGLKNLPDLNKETRLSKTLLDAIGKESAGSAGNNAISLSDTILLASGDPTVIGGYLLKKGVTSKKIQSAIAKKIAGKPTVTTPIAKFGKPRPDLQDFNKKYQK